MSTGQKNTEELRKCLLDFDEFKLLCEFFIHKMIEENPSAREIVDECFAKLVKIVVLGNAESINKIAESPIEKIFLNALLLNSIKSDALGIELFYTYDNAEEEIDALRNQIKNFKDFILWSNKKGFNDTERNNLLDNEMHKGKMSEFERVEIANYITKYHYFNLENKFHMCVQPKLYGYDENKKFIRPDLLFFIPDKPGIKIIVECDGFQFHGNKSSFINDRKRDRLLQKRGFQVLRYSGSEIYANPAAVSSDLLEHLWEYEDEK